MLAFTSLAFAATTLLSLTSAIPTNRIRSTGVIHRIFAGSTTSNGGLHFEPENVVASPGDLLEFHFLPKNHTVVQSSFDKPCEPLEGATGFFSGFNFATPAGEANSTFTVMVQDEKPVWYYCSQTVGDHCQKGMSGVVNQGFEGEKTLDVYKEMAKDTVTIQPSADRLASKGGWILPNMPL